MAGRSGVEAGGTRPDGVGSPPGSLPSDAATPEAFIPTAVVPAAAASPALASPPRRVSPSEGSGVDAIASSAP